MTRKRLAVILLLFTLAALFTLPAFTDDDPRLEQIRQEMEATRKFIAESTNVSEKTQWGNKLTVLEQDLENTKRRQELEEKEQALQAASKRQAGIVLQEALRAVEGDTVGPSDQVKRLDRVLRDLKITRGGLEERRIIFEENPAENLERITDIGLRLRNLDEEIVARSMERDAAEWSLRLANAAVRIDEVIRNMPMNPEPSIRLLLEKRRYLAGERKKLEDLVATLEVTEQRKAGVETGLAVSKDKLSQVDAELVLLEKKRLIMTSRAEYRRLFYAASTEKKLLAQRVQSQEQQVVAITESVRLARQLKDIFDKELVVLDADYATVRSNYKRQLMVPVFAIAGLVALKMVLSLAVFPLFLKRDNLFVARRMSSYLLVLLIILTLALFFLEDLKQVATVLGIASAAIVIALQDLCAGVAGWFVIIGSRKFSIGDRVEIDDQRGDVIDIQLLRTTLLEVNNWLGVDQPTGRVVLIPNNFVFKSKVFNYSHVHPYVWSKVEITVTFETPAGEAQALLFQILEEETRGEFEEAKWAASKMEKTYGIADTVYQPKIYSVIADSGILFRLIYCCHYRKMSSVRNRINERILAEFDRDKRMQFAYPTQRMIPTPEEGGFPVTTVEKKRG